MSSVTFFFLSISTLSFSCWCVCCQIMWIRSRIDDGKDFWVCAPFRGISGSGFWNFGYDRFFFFEEFWFLLLSFNFAEHVLMGFDKKAVVFFAGSSLNLRNLASNMKRKKGRTRFDAWILLGFSLMKLCGFCGILTVGFCLVFFFSGICGVFETCWEVLLQFFSLLSFGGGGDCCCCCCSVVATVSLCDWQVS